MAKLKTVVELIGERAPLQKKQIDKMLDFLTAEERANAEQTLTFLIDRMLCSVQDVVDAYLWFIDTFMEAQVDFMRTGKYPHSTFAEIEDYYKDTKMMKNYVIALAVTLYLFPQHVAVNRFYKDAISKNARFESPPPHEILFAARNWAGTWAFIRNGDEKQQLRKIYGGRHFSVVS